MNNRVLKVHAHRQIKEIASVWLVRIERGLTTEEHEEFKKWMHADKRHMNTLFALAQLWDSMDNLKQLGDLFPINEKSLSSPLGSHWFQFSLDLPKYTFAASLMTIFFIIGFWFAITSETIEPTTNIASISMSYETEVGEFSRINLPDLSEVSLSTNSKLDTAISEEIRRLTLHRGEAYFDVAHDRERPFVVTVGNKEVRAIGTSFSVRKLDQNDIEVIVLDGEVLVSNISDLVESSEASSAIAKLDTSKSVIRGQKLVVSESVSNSVLRDIGEKVVLEELMWRKGKLVFRGDLLPDVVEEVERYTNVKFEIVDDDLRPLRIAGLFQAGDVKGLITAFEENFNITYEWMDENHIVLRKKRY